MIEVLFISTISPYPKKAGKHIVWGGLLDCLRATPDVRLTVACFADIAPEFDVEYTRLFKARWREFLFTLFAMSARGKSQPLQEIIFRSKASADALRGLVASHPPDVVIFDTVRTQQYQPLIGVTNAFVCTFLDDLFSIRYARALEPRSLKYGGDRHILGAFGSTLPPALQRFFGRFSGVRRRLIDFERRAVRRSELRALRDSQLCLIVSTAEVEIARSLVPESVVMELRPWLNKKAADRRWDGSPTFVFLGSLQLAHNVVGVRWFIDECMSMLISIAPACSIKIIGVNPPAELLRAAERFGAKIRFLGFQEHLDDHLSTACALFAPLVFGSGVKIKMLDALCCGLPAVCTSFGAEGIHGGNTAAITLAETPHAFVNAMVSLMSPTINSTASQAAHEIFQTHYSSTATRVSYDRMLTAARKFIAQRGESTTGSPTTNNGVSN